ncbi:ABC transporter substrate-binding protein [Deinococcus gobiensis]|uniref:ABC transporter substrate-binding protein n=1 Tax=Deinococcus gobiensis TaxID=502394 RepID=UPI0002FCBACE|nr:ABC transporter substrate-binding protein [Deinococcus gobiensis]
MRKMYVGLGLGLLLGSVSWGSAVTLTVDCGAGTGYELCQQGVNRWAKQTGNSAKFFESPNNSGDHLGVIQQQLAAKSSDIDVYLLDIVWPGLLVDQLVNLTGKVPAAEVNRHFKGIVDANTVDGKLVSLPWFTDAGLLYYRTDLMKKYGYSAPPKTWTELAAMAKKVQDDEQKTNKTFVGYVWQGKNYEGLTCDALEWISSFGGGAIVDAGGKVTINNARAASALDAAAAWVNTISPKGVTTYDEEASRGIFQSGNALFMRNWPYAWANGQSDDSKVKGKIAVAPLPAGPGGKPAATLGGWNMGVNLYSKNQEAAISLIRYMTGPAEQKIRAIEGSYNPTIQSLYRDKDVTAKNPFMGQLESVFTGAVARPSGPTKAKYNQVSQAFANSVTSVLTGKAKGQAAVAKLAADLSRIKGRGW